MSTMMKLEKDVESWNNGNKFHLWAAEVVEEGKETKEIELQN